MWSIRLFIRSTFYFLYDQLEFLCGQLFTFNKIKFYFLYGQLDFLYGQHDFLYGELCTFYMVNLESFQNSLRPINNKDGCLHFLQRTQRVRTVFVFWQFKDTAFDSILIRRGRNNNLSFEDVDQAVDRLWTATETIQLLTADIGNNEDFTDAASILNLSLIKVRNLID